MPRKSNAGSSPACRFGQPVPSAGAAPNRLRSSGRVPHDGLDRYGLTCCSSSVGRAPNEEFGCRGFNSRLHTRVSGNAPRVRLPLLLDKSTSSGSGRRSVASPAGSCLVARRPGDGCTRRTGTNGSAKQSGGYRRATPALPAPPPVRGNALTGAPRHVAQPGQHGLWRVSSPVPPSSLGRSDTVNASIHECTLLAARVASWVQQVLCTQLTARVASQKGAHQCE